MNGLIEINAAPRDRRQLTGERAAELVMAAMPDNITSVRVEVVLYRDPTLSRVWHVWASKSGSVMETPAYNEKTLEAAFDKAMQVTTDEWEKWRHNHPHAIAATLGIEPDGSFIKDTVDG